MMRKPSPNVRKCSAWLFLPSGWSVMGISATFTVKIARLDLKAPEPKQRSITNSDCYKLNILRCLDCDGCWHIVFDYVIPGHPTTLPPEAAKAETFRLLSTTAQ
jgi:hypothetical protein